MLITFMLMLSVWCMGTVSASAAKAKVPVCPKKQTIKIVKPSEGEDPDMTVKGGYICIKNLSKNAKITDVKSSKKNVKAESMLNTCGFNAIHVYPANDNIKNGLTSIITFKVKQNNKTYTLKSTVTFKYDTPFKSLKIGNTDYAKVANTQSVQSANKKGLDIKAAPGYKIVAVSISSFRTEYIDEDGYPCAMSFSRMYEGKQISLLKNYDFSGIKSVCVYYEAKKPAYYTEPKNWKGVLDSPLCGYKVISFQR